MWLSPQLIITYNHYNDAIRATRVWQMTMESEYQHQQRNIPQNDCTEGEQNVWLQNYLSRRQPKWQRDDAVDGIIIVIRNHNSQATVFSAVRWKEWPNKEISFFPKFQWCLLLRMFSFSLLSSVIMLASVIDIMVSECCRIGELSMNGLGNYLNSLWSSGLVVDNKDRIEMLKRNDNNVLLWLTLWPYPSSMSPVFCPSVAP